MKVIRGGFGSRKPASIGLVLGAGGVVGQAYQAACCRRCNTETGWDPRQAAFVVGTSAGSVTGRGIAGRGPGHRSCCLPVRHAHVAPGRRHPALRPPHRGRAAADTVPRVAVPPWNLPTRADRPGGPAPSRLPARGGRHDAAPEGPDRHLRAGSGVGPAQGGGGPEGLRICAVRRRTVPASSSVAPAGDRPAWPPPCSPPAPSPGTSDRSPSRRPSTSTGACTRPPMPMSSGPRGWTSSSSSRRCRPPRAAPTGPTAGSVAPCTAHGARGRTAGGGRDRGHQPGARCQSRRAMGLRAMAENRSPEVIEAAYEETRSRILTTPILASLGEPLVAATAG